MSKDIKNKHAVAAPTTDGKSNETTTVLPTGRNGKPTKQTDAEAEAEKAKAKAIVKAKQLAKAAKRREAKKAKAERDRKATTEAVQINWNGTPTTFVYVHGLNVKDFVLKNFDLLKCETKENQREALHQCINEMMLKNPQKYLRRIDGVSKVRTKYSQQDETYNATVNIRGTLKRRPTQAEAKDAYEKDVEKITLSLNERKHAYTAL